MASLWDVLKDDIKKHVPSCDHCESNDDLYDLDGDEVICRDCLIGTEYEPEETYLEICRMRNA